MLRLRFFLNETYKIAEEIYRRRTIKSVFHKCYRKHFIFFQKKTVLYPLQPIEKRLPIIFSNCRDFFNNFDKHL